MIIFIGEFFPENQKGQRIDPYKKGKSVSYMKVGRSRNSEDGHLRRQYSFLFLFLLIFSLVGFAFHSHSDGREHVDCPLCLTGVHHSFYIPYHTGSVTAVFQAPLFIFPQPTSLIPFLLDEPFSNRAPPVFRISALS